MSENAIFEGKGVMGWFNDGNSIIMEPVTYYPVTNEEIHCNDGNISNAHTFTHSLSVYLDAISATSDDLSDADRIAIKNGTYSGSDRNVLKWMGSRLYYHCGFLSAKDQQDRKSGFDYGEEVGRERRYLAIGEEFESNGTKQLTEKWKDTCFAVDKELRALITEHISTFAGDTVGKVVGEEEAEEKAEEISKLVMDKIESIVPTTYIATYGIDLVIGNITELTNDVADTAVLAKMKKEITGAILGAFNGAFSSLHLEEKSGGDIIAAGAKSSEVQKLMKDFINTTITLHLLDELRKSKDKVINALNKGLKALGYGLSNIGVDIKHDTEKGAFYIEESIRGVRGHFSYLTYTETTTYSREWITQSGAEDLINFITGRSNPVSKIETDHNKYFIVIPKSDNKKVKPIQDVLVSVSVLKNEDPMRYGSAMICGGNASIATASQILFKFHSNFEQVGGSGEIDEQYNLIATVGSYKQSKLHYFIYLYSYFLYNNSTT